MAINFDHQRDRISTSSGTLTLNTTGAFTIPVGNDGQRPNPALTGQIRFNSQQQTFEGYTGVAWSSLGGVRDVDGNTYIIAETAPGVNNNDLDFYTDGVHRLQIDETGNLRFGDTLNKFIVNFTTGDTAIDGDLTVIGNQTFSGTLDVNSQASLVSANIEDLTDNRIVIAGTSGELEDDANFTFDGTTFNIGATGEFTVDVATGDTAIAGDLTVIGNQIFSGTLDVNGQASLASVNVEDLTSGRVVLAGVDGELEDSANLTFDGTTLTVTGDIDVTGNVTIGGNITIGDADTDAITVAADFSSNLNPDLDNTYNLGSAGKNWSTLYVNVLTSDYEVIKIDTNGALTLPVGGTLDRPAAEQGMIRYNTDDQRFEAYDGTAWTGLGGVVDVDQNTYIIAETSPGANNNDLDFYTDGVQRLQIDETGDFLFGDGLNKFTIDFATGDTNIAGNLDVTGNVTIGGNITIGDADTDAITVTADFSSSLIPDVDSTYDLGSVTKDWRTAYVETITNNNDRLTVSVDIVDIDSTGAIIVPVGTTLERPSAEQGMIRYNVSDSRFEAYNGVAWTGLGGVIDVDQNTYIIAETAPGTNNNDLDFYTDGVHRLQIDETGDFLFGDGLNKFTIDFATGNTAIAGTLSVVGTLDIDGQVTVASLNVEDLTSGRIVLIGTNGELEDSANLTYSGTTFDLGQGNFTIDSSTGNFNSIGLGEAAGIALTNLTQNRIVVVGTNSVLENSADLTFDGTTFNIGSGNFTVDAASGATSIDGNVTLGSTDATTVTFNSDVNSNIIPSATETYDLGTTTDRWRALYARDVVITDSIVIGSGNSGSNLDVEGQSTFDSVNVEDLTDNRIVIAGVNGELEDDANLTFNGTTLSVGQGNLTVDQATGNLYTAGTLEADGAVTLNDTLNVIGESTLASAIVSDLTATRVVLAGVDGALEDDANLTFDGTELSVGQGNFTVDYATGNTYILGTIETDGQATLASANVEDLTDNRIVIAGTNGELEDDANFTFDGTAFNVGATGEFTVDVATGNTAIIGTLDVDGQTTLASANIEDLTSGRVVLAGALGELEDSADFTFDGTTLDVGQTNFTVDVLTGDVATAGDVSVTGNLDVDTQATLASANIEDLTSGRVVLAGALGELEDSANLTFNGTLLTVTGNHTVTGNTTVNGNLDVDTQATLASVNVEDLTANRIVLAGLNGELQDSANFRFDGSDFDIGVAGSETFTVNVATGDTSMLGNLVVSSGAAISGNFSVATTKFTVDSVTGNTVAQGTLQVDGNTDLNADLTVDGNVTLGSAASDTVTFNADVNSNILPSADVTYDLGAVGAEWANLYVENITSSGSINITGNETVGGTLDVDGQTTLASVNVEDLTDNRIVIVGTTGELEDDANFRFDGNDFMIGAVGNETFKVDVATGNADLTGNLTVGGNLTVDGTVTTVNSTTVTIDDPVFTLGGDTAPTADDNKDRGIEFRWYDSDTSTAKIGFFGYNDSSGNFTFIPDATNTSEVFSGTPGNVTFGEGSFTGVTAGNVRVGVTTDNTIDTVSGQLTINSADGTTTVDDDLVVTGEATLASAIVQDLTDNRIVIAGTSGALEDSANLTFDNTTFDIGVGNFTVDVTTGDTAIAGDATITGTLDVDSQVTVASLNVEDLTDNRIVIVGVGGELEDDVNLSYDGTTFDIGQSNFTVNVTNGNTTIQGALTVNGESILASATVSDLTDNRIVLAGVNGALEDDANLTFDGTTFTVVANTAITGAVDITGDLDIDNINIDGNTITNTDANGNINITANGVGEVIINSATVSDLTDNRIVLAGVGGALEDDANFRFDGTDFSIGAAGTETFQVNVATGDTTIAGDLDVTGNISGAQLTSSTLTNDRVVIVGTGGILEDSADFTFNGTVLNVGQGVFTTEVATGDTNVNGDLTVGEALDVGSVIGSTSTTTGALTVAGGAGIGENLYVGGNVVIDGTLGADGGVTLGDDANTDVLTLNAKVTNSIIPTANDSYDLGSTSLAWQRMYVSESLNFTGATTENEIVVPTNLADALSITESTGDLIVINTSTGARAITIYPNTTFEGTLTVGTSVGTTTIDEILDEDNFASNSDTALATQQSIKAYVDTVEANVAMEFQGDTGPQGSVNLRTEVFDILGTANEIETASNGTQLTIGLPNDVIIGNNLTVTNDLTVNGTNATLAVDNLSTNDPIITVGGTVAPTSNDSLDKGVEFRWYTGGNAKTGFFGYDESAGTFTFIPDATNTSEVISGTAGNVVFGEGTFTGATAGAVQLGVTNDNTIDTASGNLTIDSNGGTTTVNDNLSVTGEATLSSATVSDLTDNRIVVAGTSGSLEDDSNFRFDGTRFMIGAASSEVFDVAVATGNTNITGTLNVTGDVDFSGNVSLGDGSTDDIIVNGSFASHLIPDTTDTRDLGSSTNGWRDLYLTESANFIGSTGENEIIIPTNLADGLSIKDTAGDLIVLTTTTGSQLVTIIPDVQIDGTLTLDSGSTVSTILDEDTMASNSDTALATQQSIKAYVDNSVSDLDLNFAGGTGTGTVNLLTQTFTLAGTANEIETTALNQTITIGLPNDVTIANDLNVGNDVVITGNLTVNGSTTTVSTTELVVEDNIITLNQGEVGAGVTAGSAGIEVDRGSEATVSFVWNEANDRWTAGTEDIEAGEFFGTIDGGTF